MLIIIMIIRHHVFFVFFLVKTESTKQQPSQNSPAMTPEMLKNVANSDRSVKYDVTLNRQLDSMIFNTCTDVVILNKVFTFLSYCQYNLLWSLSLAATGQEVFVLV